MDFEGPSGRKRPAKITYKKKDMYFLEIYADKLQNKLIGVCVMADGDSRYISNVEKIVYPGYFGNNSRPEDPRPQRQSFMQTAAAFSLVLSSTTILAGRRQKS